MKSYSRSVVVVQCPCTISSSRLVSGTECGLLSSTLGGLINISGFEGVLKVEHQYQSCDDTQCHVRSRSSNLRIFLAWLRWWSVSLKALWIIRSCSLESCCWTTSSEWTSSSRWDPRLVWNNVNVWYFRSRRTSCQRRAGKGLTEGWPAWPQPKKLTRTYSRWLRDFRPLWASQDQNCRRRFETRESAGNWKCLTRVKVSY